MRTAEQVAHIVNALAEEYPLADCTLDYKEAWQLLVQVRLAAQCTDERVNMISPALFARFPDPETMAAAEPADVVPDNMDDLLKLPGVGRKSANLILGDVYRVPGSVVVDTHCIRLSNRMGLVDDMKDPPKIESALRAILPPDGCSDFCHRIVYHGRAVCTARSPKCESCCVRQWCQT